MPAGTGQGLAGSLIINRLLAERLGMSEPELYAKAMENLRKSKPAIAMSMNNVLIELGGESALPDGVVPQMMVVTNAERQLGANCLLMQEAFAQLADSFGQDLWILPSSVHEVIVVPEATGDRDTLTNMVREVNSTVVEPSEVLSDHVYRFSREGNAISVA